jgi:ribosomal protein S13
MKITKRQLRSIIKESILLERGEVSVTQIKKYESEIREWVETLVDSMSDHVSDKIKDMDEKTSKRVVDNVTKAVVTSLIGEFGYVTHSQQQDFDRRDKEKAYRGYRVERGWDPYG